MTAIGTDADLRRRMTEVVEFAEAHVRAGGIPFAAFVLDGQGRVLGRGTNRVHEHQDPSAHAEVEAIRDACRAAGTPGLPGSTLLASGEPCAMCYLVALHAGVGRVYFAVDRNEAAAHGFDYRGSYAVCARDPADWPRPSASVLHVPGRMRPFQAFPSRLRADASP